MIGPFTGDYAFLSNFYPSSFADERFIFPTVEHYYQAMKSGTPAGFDYVLASAGPGEAKRRGRTVPIAGGFEENKRAIMLNGVILKFRQNPELRRMLAATGTERLEEVNTWGDRYWGACIPHPSIPGCKAEGENWLGRILMMAREVLG